MSKQQYPRYISQTKLEGYRAHGINLQCLPAWEETQFIFKRTSISFYNLDTFFEEKTDLALEKLKQKYPDNDTFVFSNFTSNHDSITGICILQFTLTPVKQISTEEHYQPMNRVGG